jgi:hypothetical protein
MVNKYHQAFNVIKPLAKIAGQKTVGAVKSAAIKAKAKASEFNVKQGYTKAKEKLDKTLNKTDAILKKFGKTIDKQKKIMGDK